MTEITIEIPEETARKARMLNIELKLLLARIAKEKVEELEKIERFSKSVAKSKLTEKDVEEISDKINTTMWEYHKKKYNI